ncbi:metallophosphoesterase family protein [Streptococcus zalophi]|uniref:Metallophosphoesterase family protein n=1 Tax=Streptococcus zalophi TaxID=640031 RepID=A0A934PAR0_9STRE|nr:metallophosphoesterase family protein [Streptococcus zalophi]MBJ8350104.1 metallophosphoesterase family protein [Streptococcus zalophi]MCR8968121.1 metallophosphatase family protein [Streptococcus zalophi]
MIFKIALLADIHGNYEALKAVIEDAKKNKVTDYWLLGDILMPGPGGENILALLDQLPVTVKIRGNWDDCLIEALDGEYTTNSTDEIYLSRLAQYLENKLPPQRIKDIREMPLNVQKTINGLRISISHHLPTKNWGRELMVTNSTKAFDDLFLSHQDDIAIFAHVHQPLLRYSSKNQIIINPGSIGQPYYPRKELRNDLRAQYAILTIDEQGYSDILFRKVNYNKEQELSSAETAHLPFLELYQELLNTGVNKDKDRPYLQKIIDDYHYKEDVDKWLKDRKHQLKR